MFVCTEPPKMKKYKPDLASLGFKYQNGQFVSTDDGVTHFEYFHTDNEHANDRRKEAMHEAVRNKVKEVLLTYDVVELFLNGPHGTQIRRDRPHAPHVSIMSTEVSKLRSKKDVIIVIGEAAAGHQDAGIWAYRIALREGGVEMGTAVGLARKLATVGQQWQQEIHSQDNNGEDNVTPGLIILNPGQLLYSHLESKPMSQTTWLARDPKHSTESQFHTNSRYNRVPGHECVDRHVQTFFEHVLPQLVYNDETRLYLVSIGDSVKSTIDYLDQRFYNKIETGLARQLEGVVLVQPNHDPTTLASEPLKNFLAVCGRGWVESPAMPFGRLIKTPGNVQPNIVTSDYDNATQETDTNSQASDLTGAIDEEPEILTQSDISLAQMEHDIAADSSYVDINDEAYNELPSDPVSVPTFSAGHCDGIPETVWPKVMNEALEFFWRTRDFAVSREHGIEEDLHMQTILEDEALEVRARAPERLTNE